MRRRDRSRRRCPVGIHVEHVDGGLVAVGVLATGAAGLDGGNSQYSLVENPDGVANLHARVGHVDAFGAARNREGFRLRRCCLLCQRHQWVYNTRYGTACQYPLGEMCYSIGSTGDLHAAGAG